MHLQFQNWPQDMTFVSSPVIAAACDCSTQRAIDVSGTARVVWESC